LTLSAGRGPADDEPAYPGIEGYRPDQRTAAMAIDHLVHHRPRFLWVALGDTDEWAHRQDYRGYVDALRFADSFVGELAAHLSEMGEYGAHTAIFVTTDHGRDADFADHGGPASAGVWLMARGGPVAKHGSTALSRTRHLRDIAPTIAAVMGEPGPPPGALSGSTASRGEVLEGLW
jgi:arylsulfatase A-like enzyme